MNHILARWMLFFGALSILSRFFVAETDLVVYLGLFLIVLPHYVNMVKAEEKNWELASTFFLITSLLSLVLAFIVKSTILLFVFLVMIICWYISTMIDSHENDQFDKLMEEGKKREEREWKQNNPRDKTDSY